MKPDIVIKSGDVIVEFDHWIYPGGEIGVRILTPCVYRIEIKARLKSANDIMSLLLLVDAIKRVNPVVILYILEIPYFPYARQDRVAAFGDPHSLKVMVKLIDDLGFQYIEVTDPHSAAIENCFQKTHFQIAKHSTSRLKSVIKNILGKDDKILLEELDHSNIILIIPDEGAAKRVRIWAQNTDSETASFIKERNPKTGELSGFKLIDGDVKGKQCLIVDDICDGGGTFMGIEAELEKAGAIESYLYVTHGIFSQGYDKLLLRFKKIFTTDSFQDASLYDPRIIIIP